jgi:competence protein ComEC
LAGNQIVQHALVGLPSASSNCVLIVCACLAALWPPARVVTWLCAGLVWTAAAADLRLSHRLPAPFDGRDVEVAGWIDDFPRVGPASTTFSLHVDTASGDLPIERLRLTWYDERPKLAPAMRLALTVRLRRPHGLMNPGGFDYETWLYLEGYSATGYVRRGRVEAAVHRSLGALWLAARAEIGGRITAAVENPAAASLLTALATGQRSRFSEQQWSDFRRTGTSHLVAISGLHIGLVAALTYLIVGLLARRCGSSVASRSIEISAGFAAAAGVAYAALAGFALPTQRALVMLLYALLVLASRRQCRRPSAVAAACLSVLAIDPMATLGASFWLSFAAVAVLLAITGPEPHGGSRRSERRGRLGRIGAFVALQALVTVALGPLVVAKFGGMSLSGLAVNVVAIPLFSFTLIPAALVSVAAIVAVPSFDWPIAWVGVLAGWTLDALHAAAAPSAAFIELGPVRNWHLWLAAAGVALALPWHRLPGRRLAWLALLPLAWPPVVRLPTGEMTVTVLDVGHGLAVIVETRSHRLLYDAGARSRSGFDIGQEVVVPALGARSWRGLDSIVISHDDGDHIGGASAVLAAYPQADVLLGPDVSEMTGRRCKTGQRWTWDGVEFSVLHPSPSFALRGNESSCVLKIAGDHGTLLLTGDIEAAAEQELVRRGDLAVDVVVAPHHGSATSSSAEFVAQTSPEIVVVSAGFDNRWGFPVPAVVARWRRVGAHVAVSGELGAIELSWRGGSLHARSERRARRHYWHAESRPIPGESVDSTL